MRLIPILLAAACGFVPAAYAQDAAPTAAAARPDRAARLEALGKAADRGDVAALNRALAAEADADLRALIGARLAAMRGDPHVATDADLRRLALTGERDTRAVAVTILGGLAFGRGDYAAAARLSAELEALQRAAGKSEDAERTVMTRQVAEILAREPRQRIEGAVAAGSGGAQRDVAGLMRVDMKVNGQAQDAVFDTGANLSVLSASTAQRLGVRMLEGNTSVGNSVQGTVAVRLGIADRLEIAGNVVRNVAFLVIDDASLSFGPGGAYKIPAILGYPVMRALGRFRMEPTAFTVEPAAPAGGERNLHLVANELFVEARVGGIAVPLYIDTGANPSHLDAAFAEAHPEPLASFARIERQLAGAGGRATGQAVRWPDVAVELASRSVRMASLLVGMPGGAVRPSAYYGVVGADLLGRFASYTIDLNAMRLELGEPLAPPAAPAR